jgi:galactosylceramidase
MREARARNPAILLDSLMWGAPAWIGNFYCQQNADYVVKFLEGARRVHGLDIPYTGVWNETPYDAAWIKLLRKTLDRNGLQNVRIVAADQVNTWNIVDDMNRDPALRRAIDVVGVHYPKFMSTPAAQRCGKPIWASEDGPWNGTWPGAAALAKAYNRNYVVGRMTKTIIWSLVSSYYDNLPLPGSGVMRANTPWSGHYEVQPALWATAHTTQFAQPGWEYLDGGCGLLASGGSYVTLKAPRGGQYSIIIETMDAKTNQQVVLRRTGGLSLAPLYVWRTDEKRWFERQPDVAFQDGSQTVTLRPRSIYSLTTTTGQHKGTATPPAAAGFPLPYAENFEAYPLGATPRFFSDQAGVFEVALRADGKGKALRQVVAAKGIEWHYHLNPFPETFLGDTAWTDYEIGVDALVEQRGFVSLFGRVGKILQDQNPPHGYWFKIDDQGRWELRTAKAAIAAGRTPFVAASWHTLRLKFAGKRIEAFVDGRPVAGAESGEYAAGMVGLGSGWHGAQFDNLTIQGR